MSWRCPRCGDPNVGSACSTCGDAMPSQNSRLALLAETININYGTVNNYHGHDPVPVFLGPQEARPLLTQGTRDGIVKTVNAVSLVLLFLVGSALFLFLLAVFLV